jgi:hypothetical protein
MCLLLTTFCNATRSHQDAAHPEGVPRWPHAQRQGQLSTDGGAKRKPQLLLFRF